MPHRLTLADRAFLRSLIENHHAALAIQLFGADALSSEEIAAARRAGFLTDEDLAAAGVFGTVGAGYEFGAELLRAPEVAGASPADFAQHAPRVHRDLSDWEQRMAAAARERGAQMIVGLGNKTSDSLIPDVISSDNAQALEYRRRIAEATARSIELGETWTQLRGELGDALEENWTRDLARIAATETQRAVNDGYATALEVDFGAEALAAVIPQPDACPRCRRWYLGRDGKPRVFVLADLPGPEVNFKTKAADQVPCRPPAHPWCHCQLVHVEPGWGFDDDWTMVPPKGGATAGAQSP